MGLASDCAPPVIGRVGSSGKSAAIRVRYRLVPGVFVCEPRGPRKIVVVKEVAAGWKEGAIRGERGRSPDVRAGWDGLGARAGSHASCELAGLLLETGCWPSLG